MQYDNERKYIIETAIGLQDVDNLKNSQYFLKLSNQYLNGEISIKEFDRYICSYYESNPDEKGRTKEADIVASKISNILSEKIKFELSTKQLILIHRYLFADSLDRPGSFRKRAGILGYSIAEMKASRKIEHMSKYYFRRK